MKSAVFAIVMLCLSGQVFGASILQKARERAKCLNEDKKFENKIVGNTLCHKGQVFEIPKKYDEDEMVQIYKNGKPTGEYQFLEVYCFNNNFNALRCKKFNKKPASVFDSINDGSAKGVFVDSKWYPACSSASADADGDSWGWEDNKSCKVL